MQAVEQRVYLHVDEQSSAFLNCAEQQPESFVLISERGPDSRRLSLGIGRVLLDFEYPQRLLPPAHPGIHERELEGESSIATDATLQRHGFFPTGQGIGIPAHLAVDLAQATIGRVI